MTYFVRFGASAAPKCTQIEEGSGGGAAMGRAVGLGRLSEGFAGGGDAAAADLAGAIVEAVIHVPLLDEDQLSFHVVSVPKG